MNRFENQLKQLSKEKIIIPRTIRKCLDDTYLQISKKENKHKSLNSIFIKSGLLILSSLFLITLTPIGQTLSNYLQFYQFHSNTLKKGQFVSSQKNQAIASNTKIKIEEVYSDQKQLGIHFSVVFPSTSKLLNDELTDYQLGFTLKEKNKTIFSNLNRDQTTYSNTLFEIYTTNQQFDPTTKTLDITYFLTSYDNEIPSFTDLNLVVQDINGWKKSDSSPGLHTTTINQHLTDTWKLAIDSNKIKKFSPLSFIGTLNHPSQQLNALAYPTMFVIKNIPIEVAKNTTDTYLLGVVNGKKERYKLRYSSLNGKKVEWTFDYNGYDQLDSLYLEVDGKVLSTITKKEK
ncbi:MAG: hypothetical protein ACK5NA_05510 [Enterococcus sp.]